MESARIDPDKLKMFSFVLYSQLAGAVTAGMVHLGDKLGLYRMLAGASAPMTSGELAEACNLHERWVREWVSNQVAARLVDADHGDPLQPRFALSPEASVVLADDAHPAFGMGMFHRLPATMERLTDLPACFATGRGFDYDA
ncbi:MAG: hypothetical protein ACKOYL_00145, partial [Actinomycetota bacterium]